MKLYHGSNIAVEKPAILSPNRNLDFGAGFYCTANKRQAVSFSRIVKDRRGGAEIISEYDFDKVGASKTLDVKRFIAPESSWLDFVMRHRNATYSGPQYDIIWGPVANDRVYRTLVFFASGELTEDETLSRLQINKLYSQIVFASDRSLKYLRYIGSTEKAVGL
jgi:hypothetical protein